MIPTRKTPPAGLISPLTPQSKPPQAGEQPASRPMIFSGPMVKAILEGRKTHADSFGPMLDPTLWRDAHGKMNDIKGIIEAALPLKRAVLKLQPKLREMIEARSLP